MTPLYFTVFLKAVIGEEFSLVLKLRISEKGEQEEEETKGRQP